MESGGEDSGGEVAQELVAEVASQVRTLSSIEGLRQMVSFPFGILKNLTLKVSANSRRKSEPELGDRQ